MLPSPKDDVAVDVGVSPGSVLTLGLGDETRSRPQGGKPSAGVGAGLIARRCRMLGTWSERPAGRPTDGSTGEEGRGAGEWCERSDQTTERYRHYR